MSAISIGDLTGRLFISYLLVWALTWLAVARRDWRGAIRRTRSWYGITTVMLIFSLGLLINVSRLTTT